MRIRSRTWTTKRGERRRGFELDLGLDPKTKKRARKLFDTRAAARDWLKQQPAAEPDEATGKTVAQLGSDWVEAVKADKRERSTWSKYESHLEHHIEPAMIVPAEGAAPLRFGDLALKDVTPAFVMKLRAGIQEKASPAMADKVMSSVRMMFRHGVRAGDILVSPAAEIRAKRGKRHKRRIRIPTIDEMRTILDALELRDGKAPTLGQVWIPMAAMTGLRPSELRGLGWNLLLMDRPSPVVRVENRADEWNEIGPPKSESGLRDVPLPASLVKLLKVWRVKCPASPGYKEIGGLVFPTSAGHIQSLPNIHNRIWRPLLLALGIVDPPKRPDDEPTPRYPLNANRHFFASVLIRERRATPKKVQTLMGHSSIQVTFDIYGHLWEDQDEDKAIAADIDRALRAPRPGA